MDEVLKKHKKKLVVKMKNYTFGSVNDIFDKRQADDIADAERKINNKVIEKPRRSIIQMLREK